MFSGTATKSLLKNTWFLTGNGFKYGHVFMYGSRIEEAREGEPEPEYELAELVYDFEGDAVVVHGYSLLVDLVEYVVRGVDDLDLSVFTREELRKLAKVGVVNAYMNGVTLPVAYTDHPEVVVDVARENSVRVGIVVEKGTAPSKNPFTLVLEVDRGWLYYDERRLGEYSSLVCKPGNIKSTCILVDARGYGNTTTAIEEVYRRMGDPATSYKILTDLYRVSGIDNGFVEKGALSDVIVYDLKNSLKAIPLRSIKHMFTLLSRSQQPDIVFIGGDIFYEFGENLAIPIVRINEILKKATRDLESNQTS